MPYCVRWGPSSPSPKGAHSPIFGPCLLWPNGWMNQDTTWYGGRPRPMRHSVRWGLSSPQKGAQQPPTFRPMSIVAKRLGAWINMPLGTEAGLGPGDIVLEGQPAPPTERGHSRTPHFSAHIYCGQTVEWIKILLVRGQALAQATL